jgi:hypothetical protein
MTFRIVPSYEEISQRIDQRFNYPEISESFTEEDFSREYDAAFNAISEELSKVAFVNDTGRGEGDFKMYRWVDLNRSILVVASTPSALSPESARAAHAALQRLPVEYVVGFDAHPTYICVHRDGSVIGFSANGSLEKLHAFGFPK